MHYTDYHLKIFVYEVQMNFTAPLMCGIDKSTTPCVELRPGDKIVCIRKKVYVPDDQAAGRKHGMHDENMSAAIFDTDFVDANPKIFKKI